MTFTSLQFATFAGVYLIALLLIIPCSRLFRLEPDDGQRYTHLDGLRGIAAVAVVACHSNQHLLSFFGFKPLPDYGNRWGIMGVQMFFALTAFLFTERALEGRLNPMAFYIARIRRIVPLYFFAAIVTIPIALYYVPTHVTNWKAFGIEVVNVGTFGFLGAPTLTVQGFNAMSLIGVAWTLNFEWKFYVLLPVLYAVYRTSRVAAVLTWVAIAIVAERDFQVIGEMVWPFFISGCLAAMLKRHLPVLSKPMKMVLSGIALLLTVTSIYVAGFFTQVHLLTATAMFLCILFGEPRVLKLAPLRSLGQVSYSIYLLQYLVLLPIVNTAWGHAIASASPAWKFLTVFSIMAVIIPLSCLTYQFIEIPWMRPRLVPAREEESSSGKLALTAAEGL